ncbi:hypothetical protein ThrDRAFT_03800 [Frankia casuarinae]|uniref:Secreted protein n=1 Tax=Frankia casuarinae (strain DSM 45818 / CECT 9043 / HFP020203 / CcI3) TaxID=106370 RepID=Q2J820_FRACC|nr:MULTISPECIES: hypothetical protein [Frankia]ABD12572.1 putative secreted protein [Frankia casuarinae]EYT90552.1 hypothetical protein ThrDRAFT_03800 [Frankia casuarinae]OFB42110.1 hypothetical protein Manayef4_15510 [Frankia sp. CgIM4]
MSRIFYLAFGAAAGVVVVRQVAKAAASLTPTSLAGSLVQSVQEFLADVREAAAEREEEIRVALGLDGDPDEADRGDAVGAAPPRDTAARVAGSGAPRYPADLDDAERTMRLVPGARRP